MMMETDYDNDLEGFFHDVCEDFGKSRESDVADGSQYLKTRKVKEFVVSKKTKRRSKVRTNVVNPQTFVKVKCVKAREKIQDITPDQTQNKSADSKDEIESNLGGNVLTKNSVQKTQTKVQIRYLLDSSEDSDKVILDLTTKHLIEDLENLNNNNDSNKSNPKTSPIS